MFSDLGKRLARSVVLVAWMGGSAVGGHPSDTSPNPRSQPGFTSAASVDYPAVAAEGRAAAPVIAQGGDNLDPMIERGSRGVARNLLLAGIAVAAVIAVLSGVFAFRHKKQ